MVSRVVTCVRETSFYFRLKFSLPPGKTMSAELDLPYSCEYSKSGRASCKKCKEKIDKGIVRLAVMVQSPFFDGRQPNWHHYECFFLRYHPAGPEEFSNFEHLKYEDQKRMEQSIKEAKNGPVGKSNSTKKRKANAGGDPAPAGSGDFSVEYSKSNRAACKLCEEKIAKSVIRIGKLDRESEDAKRFGPLNRWFHVECFVSSRDDLEFPHSAKDLNNYSSLSNADQKMLASKLPARKGKKVKLEEVAKEEEIKDDQEGKSEERSLKKQSDLLFKYIDELKKLRSRELELLFEENRIGAAFGSLGVTERTEVLADALAFGVPFQCPDCGGVLVFKISRYSCTGNVNGWSKCSYSTEQPERNPPTIPEELFKYTFLKRYKYKPGKRLINSVLKSNYDRKLRQQLQELTGVKKEEQQHSIVESVDGKCLSGYNIAIVGNKKLKSKITDLGGKYSRSVDRSVLCAIADSDFEKRKTQAMSQARELCIPLVSEDFLTALANQVSLLNSMLQAKITFWEKSDSDIEERIANFNVKSKIEKTFKSGSTRTGKEKVKVKGGAVVDPKSDLAEEAHVLRIRDDLYSVVLNLVDIVRNKNSYYKIQVLEDDRSQSKYWVFKSWGRIGTSIGNTKLDRCGSKEEAIGQFKETYFDRTKNHWAERREFVKHSGHYYPVEIDYGNEEQEVVELQVSGSKSTLHHSVQQLVTVLFDVKRMRQTMVEFELDTEKMPLGKLSKSQLLNAMETLKEISELISKSRPPNQNKLNAACSKFYTLLPHSFGTDRFPLISTQEAVAQKNEMLDSLMKIELAYEIIADQSMAAGEDPIDFHYRKLDCELEPLDPAEEEFELIRKYAQNTHGHTHDSYRLQITSVFRVTRKKEHKRFKKYAADSNRMLLWHGSRLTNFVGILSQGLRIAPPEAPSTGYMFGKGVYFADSVSKSANYCWANPNSDQGLLLLSEVALGNSKELLDAHYVTELEKNFHSVKGIGNYHPDPSQSIATNDGVKVPIGKLIENNGKTDSTLMYNEYIVYREEQIKLRYLVNVRFEFDSLF